MKRRTQTRLRRTSVTSASAVAMLAVLDSDAGVILNDIPDVVVSNPGDPAIDSGLGIYGFTPYSTTIDLPGPSDLLLGVTFGLETKGEPSTGGVALVASPSAYVSPVETKGETKGGETTGGNEATMYQTARMDGGTVIGAGGSYTTSGALTGWENVGDIGYLGITIEIDGFVGGDLYGWVLLERTAFNELTVYEWAYEDSGAQILAGEGGAYTFGAVGVGVPEPGMIALIAAGSVAASRLRRRLRVR